MFVPGVLVVAVERCAVPGLQDALGDGLRQYLLAVIPAPLQDHLAKARGVGGGDIEAAAVHFLALVIQPHVPVPFRAQPLPDSLLQLPAHRLAADPAGEPAQGIRVGGDVKEGLAMGPLGLAQAGQVFIDAVRALVSCGWCGDAEYVAVLPDVGARVGIVFAEFQAGGHVQHLLHGGICEGTALQLGQIVLHGQRRINGALFYQAERQHADEGFGGGKHLVL